MQIFEESIFEMHRKTVSSIKSGRSTGHKSSMEIVELGAFYDFFSLDTTVILVTSENSPEILNFLKNKRKILPKKKKVKSYCNPVNECWDYLSF